MNVLNRPKVKTTYSADIDTPDSSADVIYTVLAKDNFRWRTIVNRTEDIERARVKMTEASLNPKFERVIICQAPLADDQIAFKWETIECAVRPQDEKEAVILSNTVRQDLKCMDTGVCVIQPESPTNFGKRDNTEKLHTISNVPKKSSRKQDLKNWIFLDKLKKLVEAA